MLICMQKNQLHPFLPFGDIAKILQTCCFGYFGHAWLWPIKTILSACWKLWCQCLCKKSCLYLTSFLKYYKDIANLLFRVLWASHTHQKQYQQLVGNFNVYLQTKNQINSSILLEILHFKESCNLIGQEHFGRWLLNKNFARHRVCDGKSRIKWILILHSF